MRQPWPASSIVMFSSPCRLQSMGHQQNTPANLDRRGKPRADVAASVLVSALALMAVGGASAAPPQTVEGLRFDFAAVRSEWNNSTGHPYRDASGHTYRLDLALTDAITGARVPDAKVSVNILGLGHVPGVSIVTMRPAPVAGGSGYSHDIAFRYASTYRLTFKALLPGGHHTPIKATFAFRRPD
jgi:hypothetical protein